ncbi:NBS-containing resistance-like protein, partial [Trifolium pratense]
MKARVFTKFEAKQEELAAIERDPSLNGKTRKEMGLLEFTGTQIRSNVCGINLTFSKIHFNALLGLPYSGLVLDNFEKDTTYRKDLLHRMCVDMQLKGKVKGLTDECRVLFKIILSSISPRVGDLLFQGHIIENLKKFYPELVACKITPEVLTASFLTKMHLINTKVVQSDQEFSVRLEDRLYVDGYPLISELDVEQVIQDYLKDLQAEGFDVTREMIPKAPVNMYKPKERKSKRKADTQEDPVKPDLLAQKKVKVEQTLAEERTKKKHEAAANKIAEESSKKPIILDEEESESDETQSD